MYNKVRGSKQRAFDIARDPAARAQAMAEYERDARSAGDTTKHNVTTWKEFHDAWWAYLGMEVEVFPLTVASIAAVGTLLKGADYRSAYNYIAAAKDEHLALGHPWDATLARAYKRFNMSTSRGIGPGKQATPLQLRKCLDLDLSNDALFAGGPVGTPQLITLFTYFLLREVEGSYALWSDITLDLEARVVSWFLPASKTDPKAKGCTRSWGCLCAPHQTVCPFHAALRQHELLLSLFPEHGTNKDIPFFPTADGEEVTPANMVRVVTTLAEMTGEELTTAAGTNKYGRHVWRSMGAIELAETRVDMFRIQLMARWASAEVLHYARLAPLSGMTDHVRELQSTNSLGKVIRDIQGSLDDLDSKYGHLEKHVLDELRQEIRSQQPAQEGLPRHQRYVINTETQVCHEVLTCVGAPIHWEARCSWKFGRRDFTWTDDLPEGVTTICDKCFHRLRLERKAMQECAREL